jgi:hypothetical protein
MFFFRLDENVILFLKYKEIERFCKSNPHMCPTFVVFFHKINSSKMARAGKTVATLIIGAAIGAAIGYVLATDKDKRQEDLSSIKDKFNDLKNKLGKKSKELEEDIFNV